MTKRPPRAKRYAVYLYASHFMLFPAIAQADGVIPYVGVEAQYWSAHFRADIKPLLGSATAGGSVYAGLRINDYFGVEGSYYCTSYANKRNVFELGFATKANYEGYSLEAMSYIPLDDDKSLDLILSAGMASITIHSRFAAEPQGISSEIKLRLGAGLQYKLTDHVNARAMIRFQEASFTTAVKDIAIVSAGINYQF